MVNVWSEKPLRSRPNPFRFAKRLRSESSPDASEPDSLASLLLTEGVFPAAGFEGVSSFRVLLSGVLPDQADTGRLWIRAT